MFNYIITGLYYNISTNYLQIINNCMCFISSHLFTIQLSWSDCINEYLLDLLEELFKLQAKLSAFRYFFFLFFEIQNKIIGYWNKCNWNFDFYHVIQFNSDNEELVFKDALSTNYHMFLKNLCWEGKKTEKRYWCDLELSFFFL